MFSIIDKLLPKKKKPEPISSGKSPNIKRKKDSLSGNSYILGLGRWAPSSSLSIGGLEKQIEDKLGTKLNLKKMVGIENIRFVDKDTTLIDMGMKAIEKAIANTQENIPSFKVSDIDLIIYCGVSRENLEPATAVFFHKEMRLNGATAFDITNACLGVIDAMFIVDSLIATGRYKNALLVSSEIGSHMLDMAFNNIMDGQDVRKHFPALTLGDGSVAMIISSYQPSKNGLLSFKYGVRETFGEYADLCVIKDIHTPMHTEARKLFDAALKKYPPMLIEVAKKCNWVIKEIDMYIPHQASKRAIEQGAKKFGIKMENVHFSIVNYGNMASVALPFTLSQAIDERIEKNGKLNGEKIMLAGFGSGLGVGIIALEHIPNE